MSHWQRRKILIWGKTRPELSKTYREIVCTGGVFEDTRSLVRLYPIPLRFMDDARYFAKYQWIEADVQRNPSDPRPESYRVRYGNIKVLGKVATKKGGDWSPRAEWILAPGNLVVSVEQLQERQGETGTSLGIVRPARVLNVSSQFVGASERAQLMKRWEDCNRQVELELEGEPTRDVEALQAPEHWFKIDFQCADTRCKGHSCKVLDWEIDAYYFRRRTQYRESERAAAAEVVKHLREKTGPDHEVRFFMGNISSHPKQFTIVGLWHPKLQRQAKLF